MTPRQPTTQERIKLNNAANIKRKLDSGKILSDKEQRDLADANELKQSIERGEISAPTDIYAKTAVEMSEIFHISRKTFYDYIRSYGAPTKEDGKGYNVTKWRTWMEANDKKGFRTERDERTIAEHRKKLVIEQTKKLQHENRLREGKIIYLDEAAECFQRWAGLVFSHLERRLTNDFAGDYITGDVEHNSKLALQAIDEARREAAHEINLKERQFSSSLNNEDEDEDAEEY